MVPNVPKLVARNEVVSTDNETSPLLTTGSANQYPIIIFHQKIILVSSKYVFLFLSIECASKRLKITEFYEGVLSFKFSLERIDILTTCCRLRVIREL